MRLLGSEMGQKILWPMNNREPYISSAELLLMAIKGGDYSRDVMVSHSQRWREGKGTALKCNRTFLVSVQVFVLRYFGREEGYLASGSWKTGMGGWPDG